MLVRTMQVFTEMVTYIKVLKVITIAYDNKGSSNTTMHKQ